MPAPLRQRSLCRLYLRAVLPTLAAFIEEDEVARSQLENWRFAVCFASTSGVSTTLAVRDGAVLIDPRSTGFAVRLLFLSDRQVIRAFRREGRPWVLPWGGLHHLVRVPALLQHLLRMEDVLKGSKGRSTGHEDEVSRVKLLLGTFLPAAVAELAGHDEESRRLLAPFGEFQARWSVPGVVSAWITRREARMTWGRGRASETPDVRIEFRDPSVALAAVDGVLDQLAASVTGEVSVRGMIPLAEALARVMERVSAYLESDPS